jgi:hypothetical protein
MAHPKETRDAVRRAYVFDRLSLEVAATKARVSYATAARWKKQSEDAGDDWEKAQAAQLLSGGGIETIARQMLAGLVTQYQATMESITTESDIPPAAKVQMLASLADAYNKTVSASKRILPETSELATAMQVLQKLADYIHQKHPKHAGVFVQILEPFGEVLARDFG